MNIYLVGNSEMVYEDSWLGSLKKREFTKNDFCTNLRKLKTISCFISEGEAFDYARSLRIHRPTKIRVTKDMRQFAPVIEVSINDDVYFSMVKSCESVSSSINYKEYTDMWHNFPISDGKGLDRRACLNFNEITSDYFK